LPFILFKAPSLIGFSIVWSRSQKVKKLKGAIGETGWSVFRSYDWVFVVFTIHLIIQPQGVHDHYCSD
jgi:hypothetical protein